MFKCVPELQTETWLLSLPKVGSGIEELLQGTAKDEWITIKGTILPGINSLQRFDLQIEALKNFTSQNQRLWRIKNPSCYKLRTT